MDRGAFLLTSVHSGTIVHSTNHLILHSKMEKPVVPLKGDGIARFNVKMRRTNQSFTFNPGRLNKEDQAALGLTPILSLSLS